MPLVDHLGVAAVTQLRVASPELLVAQVEEVALGKVQPGVHVLVQLPVTLPQLLVEIRSPLAGELTVEDEDVSPVSAARGQGVVGRRGLRQGSVGHEGR